MSVEIKYMGLEEANGISWSISGTNCKSKFPSVLRPATEYKYGVSCDLAMGHSYILNCESPDGGWWKSNYVVIENSVYCEYAQGTKQSNVTITGMVETLHSICFFQIIFKTMLRMDILSNTNCISKGLPLNNAQSTFHLPLRMERHVVTLSTVTQRVKMDTN